MNLNNEKTNYTWKGRTIKINRLFKNILKSKRAVSPVIAIVLLIALTVAAAAVVWTLTSGILDDPSVELALENYGVADTDGDKEGDLIEFQIRNLGADDAKITQAKLFRDNVEQTSWTMEQASYDIASIGIIRIQTIDASSQVTNLNDVRVEIRDSVAGRLLISEVKIPNALSSIPVFFDGGDFSVIDVTALGWTEYTYNTHGGGAGISVSGTDLLFNTNNDLLYYLNNDTYKVSNGLITAQWSWGDDDAIGITFRMVDELNYYWVGYTENHNAPENRAGESEVSFDGPFFDDVGQFEIHKLVNGVDTMLAVAPPSTFSIPPGTSSNPSGPYDFVMAFSGQSLSFQAAGPSGILEEILSLTDATFTDAGYFGVFSLAAQSSRLLNFQVTS